MVDVHADGAAMAGKLGQRQEPEAVPAPGAGGDDRRVRQGRVARPPARRRRRPGAARDGPACRPPRSPTGRRAGTDPRARSARPRSTHAAARPARIEERSSNGRRKASARSGTPSPVTSPTEASTRRRMDDTGESNEALADASRGALRCGVWRSRARRRASRADSDHQAPSRSTASTPLPGQPPGWRPQLVRQRRPGRRHGRPRCHPARRAPPRR